MERTNVYLEDRQIGTLRALSKARGQPVAKMVREAVDRWIEAEGVRLVPPDEWERRFDALLERRRRIAEELKPDLEEVERDVAEAVREVRREMRAEREQAARRNRH